MARVKSAKAKKKLKVFVVVDPRSGRLLDAISTEQIEVMVVNAFTIGYSSFVVSGSSRVVKEAEDLREAAFDSLAEWGITGGHYGDLQKSEIKKVSQFLN